LSKSSPRARIPVKGYPILIALLFVVLIFIAGCTFHSHGNYQGSNTIPPGYGINDGRMAVHFLDVGQGDSALIRYNGTTVLIDAGEADAGPGIVSYLKSQGIRDIDILIATHPHSDHIGGMQEILKNFNVRNVIDSGMPHTTTTYNKFLETIDRNNISYSTIKRGESFSPTPGLVFLVLSAPDGSKDQDLNDGSIVLRATYGRVNVLFEADAGSSTEESMTGSGLPLESQVLKVAHHGSPHASGRAFLERVRPDVAIISAGAENPYNFPAEDTVFRLEDAGALLFRTDTDGTVIVRTDGMTFSVETARKGMYPFEKSDPVSSTG
jgi:beta-lactamase superfamily II metal-dependent hydrolase